MSREKCNIPSRDREGADPLGSAKDRSLTVAARVEVAARIGCVEVPRRHYLRIMSGCGGGRGTVHGLVVVLVSAGYIACAGCANNHKVIEPRPGPVAGLTAAEADARAEAVRRDPSAYLRRVADHCRALRQYTLLFTRYERRGLLQQMFGPERMRCWYRQQPFSVRMKWLDENLKYGESAYVAGQPDERVRFVTRWWVPPLLPPPGINKVDLQTPVLWGESKHPLTDFGLQRLMERTLKSLDDAGENVVVTYEGLLVLPQTGATVHHLHLAYSQALMRVPIQELYIDVATDLPAGTILKLASGRIDAAYFYEDLNPKVTLSDADFLLEVERARGRAPSPGARK